MAGKKSVKPNMIAPCGMNCSICYAALRDKNQCPGCVSSGSGKPKHCLNCSIIKCAHLPASKGKYCFSCTKFPCRRIKELDRRYRSNYGMSMIDNLNSIKKNGVRKFVNDEKIRWTCKGCGELLSVHKNNCLKCGTERNSSKM